MAAAPIPARWQYLVAVLLAATVLLTACSGSGETAAALTPTPAPVVTAPPEVLVRRGESACFTLQKPAANIPNVRSYRLAETRELPPGVTPTVKAVRFVSGGANRVLEAEICYAADGTAAVPGRYDTQLELRLYSVDSDKLVASDRISPARVLPFTQAVRVQ